MKNFISISEFAELAGVSTQSIYKRIKKADNPIQPFIKQEGNQFTIDKTALQVIYKIGVEETTTQQGCKVENPLLEAQENDGDKKENARESESAESKVIKILQEQLEAQRKDIECKNNLIAELNNRLAESQRMLDQQQKLSIADKAKILELEAGTQKRAEQEERKSWFWFWKK